LPDIDKLGAGQKDAYNQMAKAGLFLSNAELSFKSAFGQAYKYGSDKQKEELKELADNYAKNLDVAGAMVWSPYERQKILDGAIGQLRGVTEERVIMKDGKPVLDAKGYQKRDKERKNVQSVTVPT